MITQGISWTHRLAVDRAQRKFDQLSKHCEEHRWDVDSAYAILCELLVWARVVDEGFEVILKGKTTPAGMTYKDLRQVSSSGQHVLAARWARNKVTHGLVAPTSADSSISDSGVAPQPFKWLSPDELIKRAVSVHKHGVGRVEYDRLFAGRDVLATLQPVVAWISEVRYVYGDPDWADQWFRHRGPAPDGAPPK